jgi:hypothetical protein
MEQRARQLGRGLGTATGVLVVISIVESAMSWAPTITGVGNPFSSRSSTVTAEPWAVRTILTVGSCMGVVAGVALLVYTLRLRGIHVALGKLLWQQRRLAENRAATVGERK